MDRYGLICRSILEHPDITQREMAKELDLSLGTVNSLIKECIAKGLILPPGYRYDAAGEKGSGSSADMEQTSNLWALTPQGRELLKSYQVDGALIIAAGFGSRFVPLTFETPKGLLEVFGERMIERQIRQLHEAGITDITIVVGYLKEKFEYLIDKFDVKLLYNPEYSHKNTLATIYRARSVLKGRNMYVLFSDNWMRDNMYHAYECGAWYSSVYKEGETKEWCLAFNKKGRMTDIAVGGQATWIMYGPAYFSREFSEKFLPLLEEYYYRPGTEQFYWEEVLKDHVRELDMSVNRRPADQVYEFENLEELRLFDAKYQNHSDNQAMELVAEVLGVPESRIHDIRCLKSGMTNKSFLFRVENCPLSDRYLRSDGTMPEHFICRIPGPGTELLINRQQEKAVYDVVTPLGITEHLIYFNGENGYKIAEYYEGARNASASDWNDIGQCMALVKRLHQSGLQVAHSFDMRERISFYELLCKRNGGTLFEDYDEVRSYMNWILDRLDELGRPNALSHLDSNVDNFLILPDGTVKLIDWEYAGMCDPLVDVSMCAIYSYFNEEDADRLIHVYLGREPERDEQFAVYAYMALGGFLWALWAVYKSVLGDEFGEYTLVMYRYAKKYYRKLLKL